MLGMGIFEVYSRKESGARLTVVGCEGCYVLEVFRSFGTDR